MSGRHVLAVLGEVDPAVLSGGTRSLLRCVPELERRGWSFSYWTEVPGATQAELEARGDSVFGRRRLLKFSVRQLRQPPGALRRLASVPAYLRSFDRILRELEPDVVIGNTVGTLPEIAVARGRGIPAVAHVLEILPGRARHRLALRMLQRLSSEVMVPSEATAAGLPAAKRAAAVVHTGIEVPPEAVAEAEGRRGTGAAAVIGVLGTVSRRKGTDVFVEAAALLGNGDLDLRICGQPIEGAERAWAEAVIARAQAVGVAYQPRVDPMAELPRWDALVLPSREDPFPNAVLEALALGVPVIASNVGGAPEMLAGGAGLIVEPDDPSALADSIRLLAGDAELRRRLAEAGRRRSRRFTIEAQADGTERVLIAALAARGRV
jgi:glycosyltransferase involved in cell wall biosynthesis